MQSAGSGFRKHKHNCHSILKQTIHILGNDDDGKTMTMRRPARSPWSIYKPGVRGRRNLSIMDGPCLSADFAVADTGRLGWAAASRRRTFEAFGPLGAWVADVPRLVASCYVWEWTRHVAWMPGRRPPSVLDADREFCAYKLNDSCSFLRRRSDIFLLLVCFHNDYVNDICLTAAPANVTDMITTIV